MFGYSLQGILFPLPIAALQKMDVFVSGAGSASVAAKVGISSIKIDILSYKVLGIMLDYKGLSYTKCPYGEQFVII